MSQTVAVFNAHRRYRVPGRNVRAYVRKVLKKRKASISVIFIDGRYCRAINRKYLNHNRETDVISFVIEPSPLEGEIYVNMDRARQQAAAFGVSTANETARLVIHGALHLIGYDDKRTEDRARMKAAEDRHVRFWFPHDARKQA